MHICILWSTLLYHSDALHLFNVLKLEIYNRDLSLVPIPVTIPNIQMLGPIHPKRPMYSPGAR